VSGPERPFCRGARNAPTAPTPVLTFVKSVLLARALLAAVALVGPARDVVGAPDHVVQLVPQPAPILEDEVDSLEGIGIGV